MKPLLLVIAAVLLTACGSPTSPSSASLSGIWAGSMATSRGTLEARFELQQTDALVSGAWIITTPGNDTRGAVNGTSNGDSFAGTVSTDSAGTAGATRCIGTAGATGRRDGDTLILTSAGEHLSNCANPLLNITWTLRRQ